MTHHNLTTFVTTVSINQYQTPDSSDDMTDYIITFAHQYKYNSRGLLQHRYSSFTSIYREQIDRRLRRFFTILKGDLEIIWSVGVSGESEYPLWLC